MTHIYRSVRLTRNGLLFFFSIFAACAVADSPTDKALGQTALRAQTMTTLNSADAMLSALQALQRKDVELAVSTLEAQLKSEMTMLYTFLPELTDEDRRTVQETLREAEHYAREHNLKVVKP